jgi:hypothetical protein
MGEGRFGEGKGVEGWWEEWERCVVRRLGLGIGLPIGITLVAVGASLISSNFAFFPLIMIGFMATVMSLSFSLTLGFQRAYSMVRGKGERAKFWAVQTVACNQVASEVRLGAVRRVYISPGMTVSAGCGVTIRQGTLWAVLDMGDGGAGGGVPVPQMLTSMQVPRGEEAIEALEQTIAQAIARATGSPCDAGAPPGLGGASSAVPTSYFPPGAGGATPSYGTPLPTAPPAAVADSKLPVYPVGSTATVNPATGANPDAPVRDFVL